MTDYMFEIPDIKASKITLTKECVTKEGNPQIEYLDNAS